MVLYHMYSESVSSRFNRTGWTCAVYWKVAQYVILPLCRISEHPRNSTIDNRSVQQGSGLSRKAAPLKICRIGRWVSALIQNCLQYIGSRNYSLSKTIHFHSFMHVLFVGNLVIGQSRTKEINKRHSFEIQNSSVHSNTETSLYSYAGSTGLKNVFIIKQSLT